MCVNFIDFVLPGQIALLAGHNQISWFGFFLFPFLRFFFCEMLDLEFVTHSSVRFRLVMVGMILQIFPCFVC